MKCYVYKGSRRDDHYLYLPEELSLEEGIEEASEVPPALLNMLGELSFVIEFDLQTDKKLAQAEAAQVLADIEQQGFYLQMPKRDMRAEEDRLFS
jgi:uncharacterized protein YcgL (UPF0745 family)